MQLKDYLAQQRGNAKLLAKKLGISMPYLSQTASSTSAISPERAIEIERHTDGIVNRADCLPEKWMRIWPEFIPKNAESTIDIQTRL